MLCFINAKLHRALLLLSQLCDSMDCNMPGLPVLHYLLEFAQVHIHWIDDAIQPSHPLSPSSFAFKLSQQQSFPMSQLFASGGQSTGVSASASVLPMSMQGWFSFGLTGLILLYMGSQEASLAPLEKASILQRSVFSMVQLSHPYMTTYLLI